MDIVMLVGESGSGKTTAALRCTHRAWQSNRSVGGIVALGTFEQNRRDSFQVVNLATGEKRLLAKRDLPSSVMQGPFGFSEEGLTFGHKALRSAIEHKSDLVVVDEVGPLELSGSGWAEDLHLLSRTPPNYLLLTVRPAILEEVRTTFFPKLPTVAIAVSDYQHLLRRWHLQEWNNSGDGNLR